jgi:thioesterase domain-containing protein
MAGVLEFHGRLDAQLKVRGFRVEPGEIEAACRICPGVRDATVVLDPTRSGNLAAFIVCEPGSSITPEDIRRRLDDQLPAHLIPSEFVMLDTLPLTPNGKVDRVALSSRHRDAAGHSRAAATPPLSATADALSRIWRNLLQTDAVGIHDDFFQLGGHSLLAMRMFAEVHATLGRDLPFSSLLAHPTIAALARLLDGPADTAARSLSLVPLKDHGTQPPLFLIHGIGNEVWTFRDLADHVHIAQPVYGLVNCERAVGPRSVQDRVKAYLPDLERLLPSGPFALGGYCLGAVMAFELARQLREGGRRDCLLVVFDYFLEDARVGPLTVAANAFTWLRDDLLRKSLGHNAGRARSRLRLIGTRIRGAITHRREPADVRDVLGMWRYPDHEVERLQHDIEAMRAYRFGTYDGPIHVFRAQTRALGNRQPVRDMGWGRVSTGAVTVETVPGSHDTMLQPPFVRTLASRLDSALRRTFDTTGPESGQATAQ